MVLPGRRKVVKKMADIVSQVGFSVVIFDADFENLGKERDDLWKRIVKAVREDPRCKILVTDGEKHILREWRDDDG